MLDILLSLGLCKMIYEIPNFLNQEQLDYINNELSAAISSNPDIFKVELDSNRDGKSILISSKEELKNLDSFLFKNVFSSESLLSYLQKRYSPFFDTGDGGYEFHRYAPGDLCNIHHDGEANFRSDQNTTLLRFASVVLHLNTPSSGGDLVFPTLNKTVKTEAGKLVIFPPYGFAKHYTTESTDNRDVIVTWFVYKNLTVHRH